MAHGRQLGGLSGTSIKLKLVLEKTPYLAINSSLFIKTMFFVVLKTVVTHISLVSSRYKHFNNFKTIIKFFFYLGANVNKTIQTY